VKTPVRYEAGFLLVPEGPGLGVEVDEALLDELTREAQWTFGTSVNAAIDRLPVK